jgi:hypothetical protein
MCGDGVTAAEGRSSAGEKPRELQALIGAFDRRASESSAHAQRRCYSRGVQVVLRKLSRGSRAVSGRLVRAPRRGSVVVIEFSDGMHEYVTTPVKRVLRMASSDVFYIETVNSRYRLEVRDREQALEDVSSG